MEDLIIKSEIQERKDKSTAEIMKAISRTYVPESGVYKIVEKGLGKLNVYEIGNLMIMLQTSRK